MTTRSSPSFPRAVSIVAVLVAGLAPSTLLAQVWVPKGPGPGIQGIGPASNSVISGNPFSGALEAVVAHPTNPNILYVGSVNGGVFRTVNATSPSPHWDALLDDKGSLSIGALELDPTDGTHNTLVAGIGRQSSYGFAGGARIGLFRTTNGGASWSSLPFLTPGNIVGLAPRGSTMVAAFDGPGSSCSFVGIWRSTDTGATFTQVSNGPQLPCGFALDLASDPTNSSRLFAPITGAPVAADSGLYRTTNTGATWTQVGSGSVLDAALQANPTEVQVTVGKAGGAAANVFVAICQTNKLSGLFYSSNAGNTWTALDLPMTNESGTNYGIHPGGQCNIHLSLAADPVDDSVVYIGGDRQPANNEAGGGGTQFPNSIGANGYFGRLFKVDADLPSGSQATPITNCPTASAACGGARRTLNNTGPHADSREMVFDANGDMIQTDDGGVYRHTNPRGTNGDWFSIIGDLPASEQHDIAYDTASNVLISGLQDNNVVTQVSPASSSWQTLVGGDGGDVVVGTNDPLVPGGSIRYASAQTLLSATRFGFNSSNGFVGFSPLTLTPLGGAPAPAPLFVTPIAINAADPTRLIVGAANGIYESFDRLDSVSRISTLPIGNSESGGAIAYGVASNHDALYHGTSSPGLQHVVYARIPPTTTTPFNTLPGGGGDLDPIVDVVMDPANPFTALAVDKNSVYATNNPFSTWTNITGNLFSANPAGNINTVEFFNSSGYRAVVGTDTGVYASTAASGFTSWSALGTDLPNAPVYELVYDPENDLLVAATMGRGAWTFSFDGSCPWERVYSNTTLSSPLTSKADGVIYLGPNLTIDNGSGVNIEAGQSISISNNTSIGGKFTATIDSCP